VDSPHLDPPTHKEIKYGVGGINGITLIG